MQLFTIWWKPEIPLPTSDCPQVVDFIKTLLTLWQFTSSDAVKFHLPSSNPFSQITIRMRINIKFHKTLIFNFLHNFRKWIPESFAATILAVLKPIWTSTTRLRRLSTICPRSAFLLRCFGAITTGWQTREMLISCRPICQTSSSTDEFLCQSSITLTSCGAWMPILLFTKKSFPFWIEFQTSPVQFHNFGKKLNKWNTTQNILNFVFKPQSFCNSN